MTSPLLSRRCWITWAAAALAGCASLTGGGDRIVEVATGRVVGCAELAAAVQASRYALLGEQHDQAAHHQRRAVLIERLAPSAALVAEHLPRGAPVPLQGPLLPALEAAGFSTQGWAWPLHQPLFEGIARSGLPLRGGNLRDDELRAALKQGAAALPAALQAAIESAPLDGGARAALDADLQQSHGGEIPAARMQAMRTVQRARDASMWLALRDSGGRPAVLLAGNGHVRQDYGVPQLIRAVAPGARVVSVGFATLGEAAPGEAGAYTYVWTVDPAGSVATCGP